MDEVTRAMAACHADDHATAVRAFDRAHAAGHPAMTTRPVVIAYARSLLAAGRADDAVAHLASAHAEDGHAAVATLLGVALLAAGQASLAVATLLDALTTPHVATDVAPFRDVLAALSVQLTESALAPTHNH